MVTIPTGTWVDNNVDAGELRKSLGAALVVPAGGPVAPRPGRLMGPGSPLTVSPTAPASMAVLVKAGKAHLYRSAAYGPILGVGPDGDVTVPITAPGTGSQWYRIYLHQRDASAAANDADSLAVVDAVAGAAAASPTKPNLPAGALLLGEVLVPAGATSITAAMVTDLPTYTAPRGAVVPAINAADRNTLAAYPTLAAFDLDTGRRRWYDGARWRYEGDRVSVSTAAARDLLSDAYEGLEAVVANLGRFVFTGSQWTQVGGWVDDLLNYSYGAPITAFGNLPGMATRTVMVPAGATLEAEMTAPLYSMGNGTNSFVNLYCGPVATPTVVDTASWSTGTTGAVGLPARVAGSWTNTTGAPAQGMFSVAAATSSGTAGINSNNSGPVRLRHRVTV